jgi:hypothetical protein
MRTRTAAPSDQRSAVSARWLSTAAATAPLAEAKLKKQASPSVPKRSPPCAAALAERIARWRSSTAGYASPTTSRSRVEASTSVKSSVATRACCTAALYPGVLEGTRGTRHLGDGGPGVAETEHWMTPFGTIAFVRAAAPS